jgi:hypothetical protein
MWHSVLNQNSMLTPEFTIFALNVAAAAAWVTCVAVIVKRFVPRAALPLRHRLFCVALILMLACPLPLWITSKAGLGLFVITPQLSVVANSMSETDRESLKNANDSGQQGIYELSENSEMAADTGHFDAPASSGSPTISSDRTETPGLWQTVVPRATTFESVLSIGRLFIVAWMLASLRFASRQFPAAFAECRACCR